MEGGIQTAPMEQWKNIIKTQEVHPWQVGEFVLKGWVILMAYMRRTDVPHQEFQNNYVANSTRSVYEPVVLIGQTNIDSMMQELDEAKAELNRLRPHVADLSTERDTLKREHATMKDTLAVITESKTNLLKDLGAARERYGLLETAKTKIEGDITKIRRALGEIRMKEILGEG